MASFLYKYDVSESADVQLRLYDLESHSLTQKAYPDATEAKGWYEGHYTPDNEIECRTPTGRRTAAEEWLQRKWPTFEDFIRGLFESGDLPYTDNTCVRSLIPKQG
jgi:hypothetical protein